MTDRRIPKGADHWEARIVACPAGHPYTEENTIHYRGRRYCRTCHRERGRRAFQKLGKRPGPLAARDEVQLRAVASLG